jgi:hypothetical protein
MNNNFRRETPKVPTDPRALSRLERHLEIGEFGEIAGLLPTAPRFLVTYMQSVTTFRIRSATVVTVTNQSTRTNYVSVSWFKGFTANSSPVGLTSFAIPPDFTVDFASRSIPDALTGVNSVCNPELTFDEGRAIVSSSQAPIGVSSRIYYTAGDEDLELLSITDSKIVGFCEGNRGD